MKTIFVEERWSLLAKGNFDGYYAIRITDECIPELYLAKDQNHNYCVILSLGVNKLNRFENDKKEFISIEYFDKSSHIIIKLHESSFLDLFNELILSIYRRIHFIEDSKESSAILISTYFKWSEFFIESNSNKLSENEIQGLFGELFFLLELINEDETRSINEILRSWTGPYDKSHDFTFEFKDFEIKTVEKSKNEIRISSEFQLQEEIGKSLELVILFVDKHTLNSLSVRNLLDVVKNATLDKNGDISIILKALKEKNLSRSNIHEYDNFRFEVTSMASYNCMSKDFPKIVKTNTYSELFNIKYSLRIQSINNYLIKTKEYNHGNR